MRPYLAVLKDSLREALASRILWLLTGLITLVLFVGLAPFMLYEESAARFQRNEFRNGPEFLKFLATQEKAEKPTAARRIWRRLPEDLRRRIQAVNPNNLNEQVDVLNGVRNQLNGILGSADLYDASDWPRKSLSEEAQGLVDRGLKNLSAEELRRLDRLLIDAALPDYILPAPGKVLYAAWFGYRLGAPLPFEPKQMPLLVNFALAALITFLAGILGVFIAILVTASIIPQTFDPGAIDLLLSKPVSRSLLFLTKFCGASTFILLNSIYLIGGMWLIAGLRFEIWSGKLLLCIPVFLFLFVIYYSISALTGVIWKNAVVSVCCTILFWGLCFSVGTAKNVMEGTFLDPTRLAAILPAGETLLAVNKGGQTFEWSAEKHVWEEVFTGKNGGGPGFFFRSRMMGPVYDSKTDRIYAIESTPTRFELFGGSGKLLVGPRQEEWRRIENTLSPNGAQALLLDPESRVVVVSLSGIYRLQGDASREHQPFKILGVDLAPHDRSSRFVSVGPSSDLHWRRPFSAAMNPIDGSLAVVSHGELTLLSRDADKYAVKHRLDLKTNHGVRLAFSGSRLVVVQADGAVRFFAAPELAEQKPRKPRGHQRAESATISPDGRWLAVLFDDRHVWLYDLSREAPSAAYITGQGDISAVAFSPVSQLLASDRFGRVTEYEMEPFRQIAAYEPPSETLELLYRYLITPLYTVFPKPGELDALVSYLLIDEPINLFDGRRPPMDDQNLEPHVVNTWRPIGSNLAFLAAILTLTCVYIARRDF